MTTLRFFLLLFFSLFFFFMFLLNHITLPPSFPSLIAFSSLLGCISSRSHSPFLFSAISISVLFSLLPLTLYLLIPYHSPSFVFSPRSRLISSSLYSPSTSTYLCIPTIFIARKEPSKNTVSTHHRCAIRFQVWVQV